MLWSWSCHYSCKVVFRVLIGARLDFDVTFEKCGNYRHDPSSRESLLPTFLSLSPAGGHIGSGRRVPFPGDRCLAILELRQCVGSVLYLDTGSQMLRRS